MVKSTISRSCSIVMLIFQRVILMFPTCTSPHAFATCCVAIWSHTKSSILTQFWPRFRYFYRISNHPIWRARGKTLSWSFHDFTIHSGMIFRHSRCAFLPPSLGKNTRSLLSPISPETSSNWPNVSVSKTAGRHFGSRQMGTSMVTADRQYQHDGGFSLGKFDWQLSI